MYNVCLSSEIYRLAPEDLLVLPDAPAEKKDSHLHDDVVILIGDEKNSFPIPCSKEEKPPNAPLPKNKALFRFASPLNPVPVNLIFCHR